MANLAGLGMSPEDQEVALTDPKRWEAYFHDYRRCGYVDGMPLGSVVEPSDGTALRPSIGR